MRPRDGETGPRWRKRLAVLFCVLVAFATLAVLSLQATVASYLADSIARDGQFADMFIKSLN